MSSAASNRGRRLGKVHLAHRLADGELERLLLFDLAVLQRDARDRLAALAAEIGRLGGQVEMLADGLEIRPRPLRPVRVATYADHRMAMAAAVLALAVPGTTIEDVATTGKTLPGFAHLWEAMLG